MDYWFPTASIIAERCNSDGTANPDGVYVKVTGKYNTASVNGKNNTATKKIEIIGTSYTNSTFGNGVAVVMGGAVSIDKSFTIKITVTDNLGQSASAQTTIPTGQVTFDYKSGGKGVAFGKVAETDYLLESAWTARAPRFEGIKNGVTNSISSDNASYTHYRTSAPQNWFDKDICVQGNLYGGASYNKRLAYIDETVVDRGSIPASANLNNYTTTGFYHQAANANAQSGSNYPIAQAGLLLVYNYGYVYQMYYHYYGYGAWYRTCYDGTWTPWRSIHSESGWVNCGYGNGIVTYGNDPVQVRKVGNWVEMSGVVKNNTTWTEHNSFLSVPVGFRPSKNIYTVCQGSISNRYLLTVYPSGEVHAERYSNNTSMNNSVPIGSWLTVHAVWLI
ncbi:pyocin knob domain-containing protein [[Eubacterium] hominis]|uniref:pyocin knob domain-containing protein n=1 Tax=[Eubacterium] hominis TaxID=2764325 RepID=UPI003A4D3353